MNRINPLQRAQIAAQIMATLVAQRDTQTALQRAFDLDPPQTREQHFARIAADAVAATDALIRQLSNDNTTTGN